MITRTLLPALFIIALLSTAPAPAASVVRETRHLQVDGRRETWRLVWSGKPKPVCNSDFFAGSITCPCYGWAYGEYGQLALVRSRGSHEIERVALASLFGKFDYPDADKLEGQAYLQRWPTKDTDLDLIDKDDAKLAADIARRPDVPVMQFKDYDHDGRATEFLVQVGVLPCGKRMFAALGLTRAHPHLHALTSAAHPKEPLIMPIHAWEALLARPSPSTVVTWNCGDHASEVESRLTVSARKGALSAVAHDYRCTSKGKAGKLVNREVW